EEVQVEHRREFGGRQPAGWGEEAAREHVEREMTGGGWEVDAVQERLRVDVVEPLVCVRYRHRRQRGRRADVQPDQVPGAEGRAAQGESQRVPRWCARKPPERVGASVRV